MLSSQLLSRGALFLWRARLALLALLIALTLSQFIYFLPGALFWWIGALLAWLFLFTLWWQRGISRIFFGQLLETLLWTIAFLGVVIFAVRSFWAFELILLFYLLGLWYLFSAFGTLRLEGHFRVKDLARLYWGELTALFFALIGILSATAFFGGGLWLAMLYSAAVAALSFYLFASRQELNKPLLWFYLALLVVILEEVLFVLFPWQRGIFFKAFLLFVVYYLYLEFLRHFWAGNLTLKLVGEQLIFIGVLVALLLILDLAAVL